MSSNQHEKLASESAEARETRLQCVSSHQRVRLASETSRERDARLRSVREGRERQSQHSLFEQQAVRAKMQTFHATLEAPRCSTCAESFPGLQLRPPSTECVRNCTPSPTTRILAPYHLKFRYTHILHASIFMHARIMHTHGGVWVGGDVYTANMHHAHVQVLLYCIHICISSGITQLQKYNHACTQHATCSNLSLH